jgi:hypothetical protein
MIPRSGYRFSTIDWIVVILSVAALFPLVLVDIIPMIDYPNHLARMELLAAAGTPDANPYYDSPESFIRTSRPTFWCRRSRE